MRLTTEQVDALRAIEGGADVYSRVVARILRELERSHPEYLTITRAMQAPEDGAKTQPYFGAIATKRGLAAIKLKMKARI